jgi:hypothetical protein
VCAVLQQRRLLGTLTTTTDIPRRERRFLPCMKAGVSTPHSR